MNHNKYIDTMTTKIYYVNNIFLCLKKKRNNKTVQTLIRDEHPIINSSWAKFTVFKAEPI